MWDDFTHERQQRIWKTAMNPLERAKHDLGKTRADLNRAEMQVEQLRIRVGKIEAYIEMAALYESDEATAEARTRNGIAALAVRATVEMLTERKTRMHTRDILKTLLERAIVIGGANPSGNLSGFLSRSDELNNSRSEGWGLVGWGEAQEPTARVADEITIAKAPEAFEPPVETLGRTQTTVYRPGGSAPPWEPPDGSDLDDDIPF